MLIAGEGLGLYAFAHAPGVALAIVSMLVFGLFTHMACGATYALVPFIDRKVLGGVAGVIGAGGNAIAAGFLMKGLGTALCALAVRFSPEHKAREAALRDNALAVNNVIAN